MTEHDGTVDQLIQALDGVLGHLAHMENVLAGDQTLESPARAALTEAVSTLFDRADQLMSYLVEPKH